jgi:hypothetical protein
MTAKKSTTEVDDGEALLGTLRQSLKNLDLSLRAKRVLVGVVEQDHVQRRGKSVSLHTMSIVELLRRAAKVDPPLSYDRLRTRVGGCGPTTAKEICVAMGLPSEPQRIKKCVQCPRCGHCFGGKP